MAVKQLPLSTGSTPYQETLPDRDRSTGGEGAIRAQIDKLIMLAGNSPTPARAYVGDGLTASIRPGKKGGLDLQLSRTDGFPSAGEWDRIADVLPHSWEQAGDIKAGHDGELYWWVATFLNWGGA